MQKPGCGQWALALLLLLLLPEGALLPAALSPAVGDCCEDRLREPGERPPGRLQAKDAFRQDGAGESMECLTGSVDEISLLSVNTALKPGVGRGKLGPVDGGKGVPEPLRTPPAAPAPERDGLEQRVETVATSVNGTARLLFRRPLTLEPEPLKPLPPLGPVRPPEVLPWRNSSEMNATIGAVWRKMHHWQRWSNWHGSFHEQGVVLFFTSAEFIDWAFFLMATCFFLEVHIVISNTPSIRDYHATGLIFWIFLGAVYLLIMWVRLGPQKGQDWLTGYLLEFIFSIENVFIYHVVARAFSLERERAQKALVIVIVCQIVFQLGFFMGLANLLKSIHVLPYLVGAWLLYVAYHTLEEEEEEKEEQETSDKKTDQMPRVAKYFAAVFGDRFVPHYEDTNVLVVRNGQCCLTMLAPATLSLLVICFVMEVDVTLTKIEEIPNHFVAFTSSMAAAFAVPEIFFVARDLFSYFRFLKYGITFVLVFFGVQLLCHQLFAIGDMIGILILVCVGVLCMILSVLIPAPAGAKKETPESTPEMGSRTERAFTRANTT